MRTTRRATVWLLGLLLALALPAADGTLEKGQLLISAFAGFVPAAGSNWDVMYNLSFESVVDRGVSVGFAYSQKQSHAGERQEGLEVPPPKEAPAGAETLRYADIVTRLFCLEGKYHFHRRSLAPLDLYCGSALGLELNKSHVLEFSLTEAAQLAIRATDRSHYYLVASFFAGAAWYLADNLALGIRAGYQYSGISGGDPVLSTGITFRFR